MVRKYRAVSILLAAVLAFGIVAGCSSTPERTVAAEVNGEKIYLDEIDRQVDLILGGHQSQLDSTQAAQMREQFRQQVLQGMIENILIIQAARKAGFKIEQQEISARIEEIKKGFPSEEEYKAALEANGLTEEKLPTEVEKMLLSERFIRDLVKDATVTAAEAEKYYQENTTEFATEATVDLAHIFVTSESTASEVLKELKKGTSFEDAVTEYSEDTMTKDDEGRIGFQTEATLTDTFGTTLAAAAFDLGEAKVSKEAVRSTLGFHILKVLGKQGAGITPFDEAEKGITDRLLSQKQQEAYSSWLEKFKAESEIKINI